VPRQVFVFDPPERFVAGTVGQPGDRTFYLQASDDDGRVVDVARIHYRGDRFSFSVTVEAD